MALRGVQGKELPKYSLKAFSIWRELISKQKIIQNLDFLTGTGNFSILHWNIKTKSQVKEPNSHWKHFDFTLEISLFQSNPIKIHTVGPCANYLKADLRHSCNVKG
jgi:hypothetical protein